MSKEENKTAAQRGRPRRRVVPLWRSRHMVTALVAAMLVAGAAGGWWLWESHWIESKADQMRWKIIALSRDLGLTVREILVVGRGETSREELLATLRLARGAPILAFDLNAAKRRVEQLPWISSTTIERMLPDTIFLRVRERRPLALWQNQSKFSLIDKQGAVIIDKDLGRFSDLLLVVGDDAPAHAAELLETLKTQPELMVLVQTAVRVGGRRWNVRLKGGIDVCLPETDPAKAWSRLAEYERKHRVFGRNVQVLDLRLPDRLIVRQSPKPKKTETFPGKET
ncbi:MAG TPA: FtsQ-type POTRA domain-containing protein [Rhodospirillales bacterium]|jgi:cell division protein FtsQ|nr:FtsQ-type POTRA domain-containing protein [Rhodospirillales bacterium]